LDIGSKLFKLVVMNPNSYFNTVRTFNDVKLYQTEGIYLAQDINQGVSSNKLK